MKKTNTQKGITLIALIITIVVLLILAAVAIRAVQGDSIITKAKEAKSKTEKAQSEEEMQLMQYEYEIAKAQGQTSGSFTDYVLSKKYGVNIGDYVTYNAGTQIYLPDISKGVGTSLTEDSVLEASEISTEKLNGWRVLGINSNGEIELISADPTSNTVILYGKLGYETGVDELDKICYELYGKGNNAISARNLKLEDIDKLAGYDPTTSKNYGKKYIYKNTGTTIMYSVNRTQWIDTRRTIFIYYDKTDKNWITLEAGKEVEVENNYYGYTISRKISDTDISNMISKGTGSSDVNYFLSSRVVRSMDGDLMNSVTNKTIFYVPHVRIGITSSYYELFGSDGVEKSISDSLRPVVTLSRDVALTGNSTDGWTIVENNS